MARTPAKRKNLESEAQDLLSMIRTIEFQQHMDPAWRESIISDLRKAIAKITTGMIDPLNG